MQFLIKLFLHLFTLFKRVFVYGGIALMMTAVSPAHAERIKDLANIQGVRDNQLIGYGLVVGLEGTGDQTTQTPFTFHWRPPGCI